MGTAPRAHQLRCMPSVPISTEARIARRHWQERAAQRFQKAIAACKSKAVAGWAADFAHKGAKGRARALSHLRQTFDQSGALEGEEVAGPRPMQPAVQRTSRHIGAKGVGLCGTT